MEKNLVYQLPLSQGLNMGDIKFIDKNILCFIGKSGDEEFFVCINSGKEAVEIAMDSNYETVLCNNVDFKNNIIRLGGYGYVVEKNRK